ncbi:hypothetical protein J4714_13595 [Staphylococcus epidermidis]|nr:hypothetical protein [Staphylococcus epidermidis]
MEAATTSASKILDGDVNHVIPNAACATALVAALKILASRLAPLVPAGDAAILHANAAATS